MIKITLALSLLTLASTSFAETIATCSPIERIAGAPNFTVSRAVKMSDRGTTERYFLRRTVANPNVPAEEADLALYGAKVRSTRQLMQIDWNKKGPGRVSGKGRFVYNYLEDRGQLTLDMVVPAPNDKPVNWTTEPLTYVCHPVVVTELYCTSTNKLKGPIVGYSVEIVYRSETSKREAIIIPNCPACMVKPVRVALDEPTIENTYKQVYRGRGFELGVHMESLVPTKTHPGYLKTKHAAKGTKLNLSCSSK